MNKLNRILLGVAVCCVIAVVIVLFNITAVVEALSPYCEKDGMIFSKDGKTLIKVKDKTRSSFVIPDGVTSIEREAFASCNNLKTITIPGSITYIGGGAFKNCEKLENLIIPGSVTSIGDYTFYGCNKLDNITIPDSVTSIGENAFGSCNTLSSYNPQLLIRNRQQVQTATKRCRRSGPRKSVFSVVRSGGCVVIVPLCDSLCLRARELRKKAPAG